MIEVGRHIAIITTTRADWGILHPLAEALRDDAQVKLSIIAGGAHLSNRHGMTISEIEEAGFDIAARVPMPLNDDSAQGMGYALGSACWGFAEALGDLTPDLAIVLGDRFEILGAAAAALMARVPLVHIHGGEASEGQIDEQVRHAVTKMAHLHFPAAQAYADRIIAMGEDPARVFAVGSLAVETIRNQTIADWAPNAIELGLDPVRDVLAVTYHPVTLADDHGVAPVLALGEALALFPEMQVVITGVNADPGSSAIAESMHRLAANHPKAVMVPSLGHRRYLSLVKAAKAVVGNSSSGIIEAPALGTPTVNIGPRQDGRLRAASVIDCAETPNAIAGALTQALSPASQSLAARCETPYGGEDTCRQMVTALKTVPLDGLLIKKLRVADDIRSEADMDIGFRPLELVR